MHGFSRACALISREDKVQNFAGVLGAFERSLRLFHFRKKVSQMRGGGAGKFAPFRGAVGMALAVLLRARLTAFQQSRLYDWPFRAA